MRPIFALALACLALLAACSRPDAPPPRVPVAPAASMPPAAPAPPKVTDVYLEMPRLLSRINDARAARGAPPLLIDRGLALVAQQASSHYQRLGRGLEQRVADAAKRELAAFSLSFSHAFAVVTCVERLEQAVTALDAAMDPELRFAGVAVARAPGMDTGLSVVLTLAR